MNRDRRPLGSEHGHATNLSEFQSDFYVVARKPSSMHKHPAMTLHHVRKRICDF